MSREIEYPGSLRDESQVELELKLKLGGSAYFLLSYQSLRFSLEYRGCIFWVDTIW